MVGRSSGGHYLLQNGCSVGAIESASKFDSGGEITAKIRTAFNLIDVSCQTFSLVHKLIDYAFDAAIPIAHGNHDCDSDDGRGGVRSVAKSSGYSAAKSTPLIKTLALRML